MNILTIRLIVALLCGLLALATATSSNAEDPKPKKDTQASARESLRTTVRTSPTPSPTPSPTVGNQKVEFVPGQVIVLFRKDVSDERIREINRSQGTTVLKVIPNLKIYLLKLPEGVSPPVAARKYRELPDVLAADPNFVVRVANYPNDPPNDLSFGQQWYFKNTGANQGNQQWNLGFIDADIDAPEGWSVSTGAPDIKIAILDTGIDGAHPDLAGKIAGAINFTTTPLPDDVFGHGTHVAGLAAAKTNNNLGIAGTCPDCSLLNVKVLDDTGQGQLFDLIQGIYWAVNTGAKILNASLAGQGDCPSTLQSLITTVVSPQVNAILVAAAGNDGFNLNTNPVWPAVCSDVVTVAATDPRDQRAEFSNYGAPIVEIAAPGVDVLSLQPGGGITRKNGTSMAAPIVSGALGVIWAHFPAFTNTLVISQMLHNADPIDGTSTPPNPGYSGTSTWPWHGNDLWQYGRLNLCRALNGPAVGRLPVPVPGQTCDPPNPKPFLIRAPDCPPGGSVVKLDLSTGTTNGSDDQFGAQDSKWTVIQVPSSTHGQLPGLYPVGFYPAFSTTPNQTWTPDPQGANWIQPVMASNDSNTSRGFYKYRIMFFLPATYSNASIVGTFAADDIGKISLNNTPIPGTAFANPMSPFTISSGFNIGGVNELVVEVENYVSVSGLLLKAELQATCNVKPGCDLEIKKTISPNPLVSGQPATVTITVKNVGNGPCSPGPICGTAVQDLKPDGLTFTAPPTASRRGWQCALGAPSGDAGCSATGLTLASGNSVTFTIKATVTAPPGSSITNCATVSNQNYTNTANNKSCVTVTVKKKIGSADPNSPD